MKQELQDKLFNDFPLLYQDRAKSVRETLMCWGFECGDGWYDLLYELSSKLESTIKRHTEDFGNHECPRATQVKEKFGTLRFYMSSETEEMSKFIREAEHKSAITCEKCSRPGSLRGRSWVKTLCEGCDV